MRVPKLLVTGNSHAHARKRLTRDVTHTSFDDRHPLRVERLRISSLLQGIVASIEKRRGLVDRARHSAIQCGRGNAIAPRGLAILIVAVRIAVAIVVNAVLTLTFNGGRRLRLSGLLGVVAAAYHYKEA